MAKTRGRAKSLFKQARMLEDQGHFPTAVKLYAQVIRQFIDGEKFDQALKLLDHVKELAPQSGQLILLEAMACEKLALTSRTEQAMQYYWQLANEKNVVERYQERIEAIATDYPRLVEMGRNIPEPIPIFGKSESAYVEQEKSLSTLIDDLRKKLHLEVTNPGMELDGVLKKWVEKITPQSEGETYDLALALLSMGLEKEALAQCESLSSESALLGKLYCAFGAYYQVHHLSLKAMDCYLKVVRSCKEKKELLEAHYQLVDCFYHLGKKDEALNHAQKVISFDKGYRDIRKWMERLK